MSRTVKKTPGSYIIAGANNVGNRKKERRQINRRWAAINRDECQKLLVAYNSDELDEDFITKSMAEMPNKHNEISNLWQMLQDGKYWDMEGNPVKIFYRILLKMAYKIARTKAKLILPFIFSVHKRKNIAHNEMQNLIKKHKRFIKTLGVLPRKKALLLIKGFAIRNKIQDYNFKK